MAYGTLSVSDLLATTQPTLIQFGEDAVFASLEALRAAHNELVLEKMEMFVQISTDRLRRFGGPDNMNMEEIDEFGTPDAQKVTSGQNVGFPLRLYGLSVQWTRHYLLNAKVNEVAAQYIAAQDADLRNIDRAIKNAIFQPINQNSYRDRLVDKLTIPIKAFVNADGQALPVGPNGEIFDGTTHTHYLKTAGTTLVNADLVALQETVMEHYAGGNSYIMINRAQEAAIRLMTQFVAYLDARIVGQTTAAQAPGTPLSPDNIYNRAIGVFNGSEVWVKPWVPAGYLFTYIDNGADTTPLVMRRRDTGGDFQIMFEDEEHPLRARVLGREFGMGVWNRTNGAVLYVDAGAGGVYVAPTIP